MRQLKLGSTGTDVRALQQALNQRSRARGFHTISVDGAYGPQTDKAVDRVARALGALERTIQQPGASVGEQRIIRWPSSRNPRQLVRARSRKQHAAEQAGHAHAAVVHGNTVTGGNPGERVVAGARHALYLDEQGRRDSFYSQPGRWTVDHTITGEKSGERSDCSQFATALHHSAGLPDPNGNAYGGGYTGTLARHCQQITREQLSDGDLVIWDPAGPQGHVEVVEDARTLQTIGHGSKRVARHHVNDFAYKGAPGFYRLP